MKRLTIVTALMCLAALPPQAGLFKNSVDLADLAQVEAARLESLKDSEFDVFLAEVGLNAAKADERRASGAVKAAKRVLDAEQLDHKAAEAEVKAAKANEDAQRLEIATMQAKLADEDLDTAKLLVKWKEQEREAREAQVRAARSAMDLAEARRDVARVRLLAEASAPGAAKYDLGDLQSSTGKREKELESARRKAAAQAAKVDRLKQEWEQIARNIIVPVGEEED